MTWKKLAHRIWAIGIMVCAGCGNDFAPSSPNESAEPIDTDRYELVARFVHISDAQIVDEESPARLTALAHLSGSAWRPHEAYSTQLLDGVVRMVNKIHVARSNIDFLVHTGDSVDNSQRNELGWFMTVLDGGMVHPLTGPDDRKPGQIPDALLDPHHSFEAQGLYRNGTHGDAPTIPWYNVFGNHDRFAVGVLPIITDLTGRRTAPLPLETRLGLVLPLELDPAGFLSWAPITPANPGPPPEINLPTLVAPNPERRFITNRDFIDAHLRSVGSPSGHGFDLAEPNRTYYSVSPVPGIRLIALNTATPLIETPGYIYSEGAISVDQLVFLKRELGEARDRGELVVLATHHPSDSLTPLYGTALTGQALRSLLDDYPCVKLHIAGHLHRNAVIDRGGHTELVTSSILDAPQQGRIIELWRSSDADSTGIELRYWMFSHLDEIIPIDATHAELFADPLLPMRRLAGELAGVR